MTIPVLGSSTGLQIGIAALDPSGNVISLAPGANCSVAVTSPNGITLGGGQIGGLGVIGNPGASAGSPSAIAIGNGASTDAGAQNATALGTGASAAAAGSVALGSGAIANRLNASAEQFSGSALRTTLGVVSVGSAGNERQITNVAGGSADTDAVNLRQLRSVGSSLAAGLGGGATFSVSSGAFTAPTYTIRGTGFADVGSALGALDTAVGTNATNIATTVTNLTTLQTNIANGTVGLLQQNATTRAITVGASTNGSLVDVSGSAGARRITGVAAGTTGADAVNVSQLTSALAGVVSGVPTVASENGGGAALPVATGARSVAVGYGSVAGMADTFSVGAPGSARRIVNVGAGIVASGSTDAVNGGQLAATNVAVSANTAAIAVNAADTTQLYGRVATSLGGGAAYDPATQTYTFPNYAIRGTTYNSVGGALAAVDTAISNLQSGGSGGTDYPVRSAGDGRNDATPVAGAPASLAAGLGSRATANSSSAIGHASSATGVAASSFGAASTASADSSTAIGSGTQATGTGSSAIGMNSRATGANTTAVGMNSAAQFEGSTAIGAGARALADPTTAVGYQALASGNDASAFGAYAAATATNATALGRSAQAGGSDSTAIGVAASASGAGSVALGQGASAAQVNAVAIGAGVNTVRPNQVAIGSGQNTYTLAGIASTASNAAQTGSTRFVTTDAAGNLGTAVSGPGSVDALANQVSALGTSLTQLSQFAVAARHEARSGIASAMAMSSAPMPSAPGRTSWAANGATFKGEWASGFALAHRLDTAVPMAVTVGYSYGDAAKHGVRMGLAGEF